MAVPAAIRAHSSDSVRTVRIRPDRTPLRASGTLYCNGPAARRAGGGKVVLVRMTNRAERFEVRDEHVEAYERDGAALLPGAVGEDWQGLLRGAVARALKTPSGFFYRRLTWREDADLERFCRRSPAAGIAAALMRTDKVNLLYDQIFVKEPGTATVTGWHNDQPYWPVRGWPVTTLWIALDPVTAENGALEFIRGSHAWDRWFQTFMPDEHGACLRPYPDQDPAFEPLVDFEAERGRHDIVSWDMRPGDAVAFHGLSVHGARGNVGAAPRRGYAVRFAGRDARYEPPRTGKEGFLANPELRPGDPLDSALFPVVYEAP